jgi:hypothetical protein
VGDDFFIPLVDIRVPAGIQIAFVRSSFARVGAVVARAGLLARQFRQCLSDRVVGGAGQLHQRGSSWRGLACLVSSLDGSAHLVHHVPVVCGH